MNKLEQMMALDCEYIESFAHSTRREWGVLFYNETQPTYYDANHAQIWQPVTQTEEVLLEIKAFYEQKSLTPRIYLYNVEQNQLFIQALKQYGFQHEELSHLVQLWNGILTDVPWNKDITVEQVTRMNYEEALDIECSISEFGGREVREMAFAHEFSHPQFTYYLLRYEGVACCTACLFHSGKQARIESVATLEKYRGKGLIGRLIHHLQRVALELQIEKLWVFPINERVERVYEKSGFQRVFTLNSVHAFTSGRSIREIQSS